MTVQVLEVEATAAPSGIDLAVGMTIRLAAVGERLGFYPAENGFELLVADVKREVQAQAAPRLEGRIAPGVGVVGEVKGEGLIDLHLGEVAAARLDLQAEDLGEEAG